MTRRAPNVVTILVGALLAAGCSGGSPTSPSATTTSSAGSTNVAGAFAVMKNGEPAARSTAQVSGATVPSIVFHGDADQTVHPKNGEQVIAALLRGVNSGETSAEQGTASGGRSYTRSIYRANSGEALAEHWLVKGAGHAWSGGSAKGSYTDAQGPDATAEMVRFFFEQPGSAG